MRDCEACQNRHKYEQAESLYQRALAIREKVLGPEHSNTAFSLNLLARLYLVQGRYDQAEPIYQRALAIYEQTPELEAHNLAKVLENYADLLQKTNREAEAAELEARAKTIRARHIQENIDQ